jgi:hypothetical protein
MRLRQARLWIHRLEPHTAHQAADMISTDYKPQIQKTVLNPTTPVARVQDVMLIDFLSSGTQ